MSKKEGPIKHVVMVPKEDDTSYAAFVANRQALIDRIAFLKSQDQIGALSSRKAAARRTAEEQHEEVQRFRRAATAGNRGRGHGDEIMDAYQQKEFEALREAASAAENAAEKAEKDYEAVSHEINELEEALVNGERVLSAQHVLAYQRDVAAATETVADLRRKIGHQQQIIDDAKAAVPQAPDRSAAREEIMADIAMGTAGTDDLVKHDALVDEERKACDTAQAEAVKLIDPARQTIAGLTRRLDAAVVTLNELEVKKEMIIREFLWSQAEQLGAEYADLARKLSAKYSEIRALDLIMGSPSKLCQALMGDLSIPLFRVKACHEMGHFREGWRNQIVNDAKSKECIERAKQAYLEYVRALGIEL